VKEHPKPYPDWILCFARQLGRAGDDKALRRLIAHYTQEKSELTIASVILPSAKYIILVIMKDIGGVDENQSTSHQP